MSIHGNTADIKPDAAYKFAQDPTEAERLQDNLRTFRQMAADLEKSWHRTQKAAMQTVENPLADKMRGQALALFDEHLSRLGKFAAERFEIDADFTVCRKKSSAAAAIDKHHKCQMRKAEAHLVHDRYASALDMAQTVVREVEKRIKQQEKV